MTDELIDSYVAPHPFKVPQTVLPDGAFLMMVCTNKARLDALLSALSDWSEQNQYPLVYDHSFDIINALANVYTFDGLECGQVDFCELIAQCITNGNLDDVLNDWAQKNGYEQPSGDGNKASANKLSAELVNNCNNNNLFAAVSQLVDFVHNGIVDVLERVESATGRGERISAILEAIPLTNLLAIDDVIQFGDQLIENFTQNYDAQYTQALRDEYRCDLFCLAQDDCTLTFQDMADYFAGRAAATFDAITVEEALDWFVFGTFNGALIVHGMHALFASVLTWGSEFVGVDIDYLARVVQAASNDTDPDWSILCDDCPPEATTWCNFTNFGTNFDGAGDYTGYGSLQSNGFVGIPTGGFNQANVNIYFSNIQTITEVDLYSSHGNAGNDPNYQRYIALFDATDNLIQEFRATSTPTGFSHWNTGVISVPNVARILIQIRNIGGCTLEQATVKGVGVYPYTLGTEC